jgi:hypothetical protein
VRKGNYFRSDLGRHFARERELLSSGVDLPQPRRAVVSGAVIAESLARSGVAERVVINGPTATVVGHVTVPR